MRLALKVRYNASIHALTMVYHNLDLRRATKEHYRTMTFEEISITSQTLIGRRR
jgi:hypothetical protein